MRSLVNESNAAYLQSVGIAVPRYAYDQQYISSYMQKRYSDDRKTKALVSRIYKNSGIETRHSVLGDVCEESTDHRLFPGPDAVEPEPSTKARLLRT